MLKTITLIFSVALLISSCAHQKEAVSPLYDQYVVYMHSVTKQNVISVADKYFSKSLLGTDYKDDPDAPVLLAFHTRMVAIDSHAETTHKNHGCLIINGYNDNREPLIFRLQYIYTGGNWLISWIHIIYPGDASYFSRQAECR